MSYRFFICFVVQKIRGAPISTEKLQFEFMNLSLLHSVALNIGFKQNFIFKSFKHSLLLSYPQLTLQQSDVVRHSSPASGYLTVSIPGN